MLSPLQVARCCLSALLLCAMGGGCAHFRLPAIDPSGERIFLPCPNSTTLATAPGGVIPHPLCPKPAFATPPQPPACPPGTLPLAQPGAPPLPLLTAPPNAANRVGRVVVTPAKIMAQVGSEVVLMGGLCGADGHFVTRQPIEWMLSQESVGQFVEVGDGGCHCLDKLLHQTSKKKASNLALGYTSSKAHRITRGTPNPADDVNVAAGQNWVSVTSASEGVSQVTAFAPKNAAWEQRQQTATIYWIDAQWSLPPPAVARAGSKQTLATTVSRPRGGPIAGWLVRYEVTGGPPAGFAPSNAPAVEVQTDAAGVAAAELIPSSNQPGLTQVSVQIIRPAGLGGSTERVVVGQGYTSVNWSAAGLAVKVSGPPMVDIGAPAVYRVEISNPGDLVARDVTASDVLPPGLAYVSSNPAGQVFGDRLEWRLGDLPGQATRVIEITCRADGQGEVKHCVRARSGEGNATEGCATTRLYSPAIKVSMTGPEQATVGEQVQFRVDITNAGTKPLTNVTLTDLFDLGFQHVQGGRSPLVNVLGDLAVGETKRVAITFNCMTPGRPCHTLDVSADGEQTARTRACVTVAPAAGGGAAGPAVPLPPGQAPLQVRLTANQAQQRVGEVVEYTIEAVNGGSVPLTGVRVAYLYPASLVPERATDGNKHTRGELSWQLERMNPGEKQTWVVRCRCLKAETQATSRVAVTTAQRVTAEDQSRTEILPGAVRDPDLGNGGAPRPADPPIEASEGELKATLNDVNDPTKVGTKIEYVATLTNDRKVSDKNVVLTIILPEGMAFDEPFTGPVGVRGLGNDGKSAEYKAIAEMRAGESIPNNVVGAFRFHAKAAKPGKYVVRIEIRSQRSPQPVVVEAETTVVQ